MPRGPDFGFQPGAQVKVRSIPFGYPLPEGLPEGAVAIVKDFEPGFYTVQYRGRDFKVFMAGVEAEKSAKK